MKIASCVLLPDSNIKVAAYRGNGLEGTLRDIAEIGYDGVELFVRDQKSLDCAALDRQLERTGLEVCCIGSGPLVAQDHLTLSAIPEEKRREAIDRTKELVDFAVRYGRVPVNVGKLRGNLPPADRSSGWRFMRESFLEICEYAEKKGVMIALEPQERGTLNNINSTRDGVMWVEQIGAGSLGLLLDTCHMDIEDGSVTSGVIEAAGHIAHIHVADRKRAAPGTNGLDFVSFVKALKATNYDGFLSVEIAQPEDALGNMRKAWTYLNSIRTMYAPR
ncbi:MAG: sugar phosphate isomerase/epimerase [Methylobacteriaceae bacterium]|jgi:sugar phosphate isomerase/epimerase|nr:sugar phosphate isomerase/epimerase [Methylobacteriaceae bacterium]